LRLRQLKLNLWHVNLCSLGMICLAESISVARGNQILTTTSEKQLPATLYTVVHPSHVHPRWYEAWNLTRASHARELAKRRPLLPPAYVRSETVAQPKFFLFNFFACSLIYINTFRFEKLCTRNTCVLMSWFHSHTRFQVSSIITCQFRTDV
jgi:hypothetical protein